jgi:hypothetical protein
MLARFIGAVLLYKLGEVDINAEYLFYGISVGWESVGSELEARASRTRKLLDKFECC